MKAKRAVPRRAGFAVALVAPAVLWAAAVPASASAGGLDIQFSGAVHGTLTSGKVVCNSHVATAKHTFFLDIGGRTGARAVTFSGDVLGYSSPHTYSVTAAYGHFMLDFGGSIYAGRTHGTVKVGAGAKSGAVNLSLTNVSPGMPGGTVVVSGRFTCSSYSTV